MKKTDFCGKTVPQKYLFLYFIAAVLFTVLVLPLAVSAKTVESADGVFTVTAGLNPKDASEIVITLTPDTAFPEAMNGQKLYLFGLYPGEGVDLEGRSPMAEAVLSKSTVFRVKDDGTGERRYFGYVAAVMQERTYRALHAPVYIANPDAAAQNTAKRTEWASPKGITVSENHLSAALELGISHAVIPVSIDRILSLDRSDPDYSVSLGGVVAAFDKETILRLDTEVNTLQASGVHIFFRFILDGSARGTQSPAGALYDGDAGEAALYAPTISDKNAFQLLRGIFTYFSNRYAADASRQTVDFILGYQVNEYKMWNSSGAADDADAVRRYAEVFRIADTALRSVSANSRVYVPVSDLAGSAKSFLAALAKETDGGAFGVAFAPYESDPAAERIWETKDQADSRYLTVSTLADFRTFLEGEPMLYHGERRSAIIDDFAVSGHAESTESQDRQAASLVYAYDRAVSADFIDAFLYHRLFDAEAEHYAFGLCAASGEKKAAYELYRVIDTKDGEKAVKPYLALTGAKRWSSLVPDYNAKKIQTVTRITAEAQDAAYVEKHWKAQTLFDFTEATLHGFQPMPHTASLTRERINNAGTALPETVLTFSSYEIPRGEASSIITRLKSPDLSADSADGIGMTVYAERAGASSVTVVLELGEDDGTAGVRYTASAEIPANTWTTVAFPLRAYRRAADGADYLKISAAGGDAAEPCTVKIGTILLYESRGSVVAAVFRVVFILLLIMVLLFGILYLRKQAIRKKRRKQALARRRYLEQQRRLAAQRQNVQRNAVQNQTAQRNSVQRNPAQRTPSRQNPYTERKNR